MGNTVVTLIGTGRPGFAEDGKISNVSQIAEPFGIVAGPDGAIYFCDLGNHRIRRLHPASGVLTTVVGSGLQGHSGDGGLATDAALDQPYEVRFDTAGHLYFVDMTNHVIRHVEAGSGRIETIAGTGEAGFSGDGGPARAAALRQPHSIEVGNDGSVYIADIGNHRIRRIAPDTRTIETLAGTGEQRPTVDGQSLDSVHLNGPRALAFDESGDLYCALREGNAVYRIDLSAHTIHRVAGTGKFGYRGDGADAKAADLAGPKGISVGAGGIFIADTESHTIRRIDRESGVITTVLGTGAKHDGPDGEPSECGLARPHGVFVTRDGRVLVGDSDNHRIRALSR